MVSHTSDFFEDILKYAEKMIKDGLAYCDATDAEEMKKQRMAMTESKYRNNTLEENEKMWNEMKDGTTLVSIDSCTWRATISSLTKFLQKFLSRSFPNEIHWLIVSLLG